MPGFNVSLPFRSIRLPGVRTISTIFCRIAYGFGDGISVA